MNTLKDQIVKRIEYNLWHHLEGEIYKKISISVHADVKERVNAELNPIYTLLWNRIRNQLRVQFFH